ncbi:MAG: bifunctional metallophosphatase/5'-nucleotidase [Candidatus Lokiarchaeota archaeon]|nr:bifunctional metallophosphatase/5'-nucleotidase [Candidatus Lokiarchaeota archaeon]
MTRLRLKILHINDLHSRFEEFSKIASVIEEIRDDNTLVFDAGDFYDEWRVEARGTRGKISADLLSASNFNARVIGNTEGFSEKGSLEQLVQFSNFPIITSNIYDLKGKKIDNVKDYYIFKVGSLKVLVVGVTGAFNEFYNLFNIHINDPLQEIKRVLSNIQKTEYNLLIILSHLGLSQDKIIAKKIPNVDIIIGGHSHSPLKECVIENGTIICQAGYYGESVGELTVDYDENQNKIIHYENNLILASDYPEHQKIKKILSENYKRAYENMSQKLFELKREIKHSFTEESELGNLLADALKDFLNSDFGLINSGVLNHGINRKYITKLVLHEICPSPLNPTRVEIKGSDILLSLEKSLLEEFQDLNGFGPGFRGNKLGNIQVSSNVKVFYNPDNPPQQKIISLEINKETIDRFKWYKVATSDYIQRGTGYTDFANCRNEEYRPEFLRDLLEIYLQEEKFLELSLQKRFIKVNL